jgi:D-aminopeptidase
MSTVRGAARALGIPFDGTAGPQNAIIDVDKVRVGHDQTSAGDTQTGVTAILPIGKDSNGGIDTFVFAAFFSLNGNGEMTGTHLIEEMGFLEGPIVLTNTVSLGDVRSWVIKKAMGTTASEDFGLIVPVVAETDDSYLNDSLSFNVTQDMVNNAITTAAPDNVKEGNVGGGTGMTCYSWKGGIGTASRQVIVYQSDNKTQIPNPNNDPTHPYFTVGVLMQANQGNYWDLVIRGVPMGQDPQFAPPPDTPDKPPGQGLPRRKARKSSIIVVIATDAPLLPNQLKRLARRATHGIARTGTITDDDSGELFIAFTTVNFEAAEQADKVAQAGVIPNDSMDPLFEATVQATEEAILNALCAAETVTGYQGNVAHAIKDAPPAATPPTLLLVEMLKKYNRYVGP